jgi:pimeloyl-ACP methyl ester carboxylesterase
MFQSFERGWVMPRTARGLSYSVTDLRPAWSRGSEGNRPVVFHHGIGANHQIFDEWIPVVATRHAVARYDMRGFGQSPVPPSAHEFTAAELIADLLEVAETAFGTEAVHVMGESMGGTIALAAALEHPSRFASVAMSNAAIKGGQIDHAPGWRAEIASVGIKGWSERSCRCGSRPARFRRNSSPGFGKCKRDPLRMSSSA